MKKIKLILFLVVIALTLGSCTENERAKNYGGTMTVEVDVTQKLVNVTWKDNEMWILTRPRQANEVPETYKFYEESSWGMWEGTVYIKER